MYLNNNRNKCREVLKALWKLLFYLLKHYTFLETVHLRVRIKNLLAGLPLYYTAVGSPHCDYVCYHGYMTIACPLLSFLHPSHRFGAADSGPETDGNTWRDHHRIYDSDGRHVDRLS